MGGHKGVKIKLNQAGVREAILNNAAVAQYVQSQAAGFAAGLGPGYAVEAHNLSRVGAKVYPATEEAFRDNAENNTLAKAVYRKAEAHRKEMKSK